MTILERAQELAAMWQRQAPETAAVLTRLADAVEAMLPAAAEGGCPPTHTGRGCPDNDDTCADCWRRWLEG